MAKLNHPFQDSSLIFLRVLVNAPQNAGVFRIEFTFFNRPIPNPIIPFYLLVADDLASARPTLSSSV